MHVFLLKEFRRVNITHHKYPGRIQIRGGCDYGFG